MELERGSGRCACARGEGRDQNWAAGDLVVVEIDDEGRRLLPNLTSDFIVLVSFRAEGERERGEDGLAYL
jgi:hypothetical protein